MYNHRVVILVPAANAAAANTAFSAGTVLEPSVSGGSTFDVVRLSASGAGPATYVACNTLMTDAGRAGLLAQVAVLGAAGPGGGKAYDVVTGETLAAGAVSWTPGGCAGWIAAGCFTDMGLSVITAPMAGVLG